MKTATLTTCKATKERPLITCKLVDDITGEVLGYAINAHRIIIWAKDLGYTVLDKREV